jgi:hypothetical protein
MRIFKLATGSLVLLIIGLFVYQNLPTFRSELDFSMNLYLRDTLQWKHHLYTIMALSAALGFVAGVILMLKPYFNVRRLLAQERQEKQQMAAPPTPTETIGEKETASEA